MALTGVVRIVLNNTAQRARIEKVLFTFGEKILNNIFLSENKNDISKLDYINFCVNIK